MSQLHSVFPKPIYLSHAVRTPIGKFGGALAGISAPQLASLALAEASRRRDESRSGERRSGERDGVDFVFMGHARQAGAGPNTARQALVRAGLDEAVPAITLNQACASGMAAIFWGLEKVALGRANFVWSGGVESMSNTPYLLPKVRWGYRLGNAPLVDGMYQDGFHCPMADMVMGATVEQFIAKERGISREAQDAFAVASQKKATQAWDSGCFDTEVFAIDLPAKRNGPVKFTRDEHLRADSSMEKLAKLPTVFDQKGTLTAGNSSGITDGAAWVGVSASKDSAAVEVLDYASVALDPKKMGLGPVPAIRQILKRQGLSVGDLQAIEINEAFAAQVLACQDELSIKDEQLNQRGGAIAIGHPIGATGCRIVVTLSHILKGKPGALGLASLCVSGGQGTAVLVRSVC